LHISDLGYRAKSGSFGLRSGLIAHRDEA